MKYAILILILVLFLPLAAQQPPLPITSYDYALPENNVSPISIGMGGLNVTNTGDFYASYSNPALIGANEYSLLLTAFRLTNAENLSFAEAASISSALRDKQFKYFTLLTKQSAWSYQPMARLHIVESNHYYDYQMDKVQATLAASDQSWRPVSFGLNLKYMTGRLVYLNESRGEDSALRRVFIDDKVKGISSDLGLTLQMGDITYGLAAYDILSQLWWEHYDSVALQRRIAFGVQYDSGNLLLSAGLQGKLSQSTDTTFHLGLQNSWNLGSSNISGTNTAQAFGIRLGLYSHDFHGSSNINYTFGTGYNYSIFRFDFSLNNKGLRMQDSEYLFSLGVGLP